MTLPPPKGRGFSYRNVMANETEIMRLALDWVKANKAVFDYGANHYAKMISPLYLIQHGEEAAKRAYAKAHAVMDELNEQERKTRWSLYEALEERMNLEARVAKEGDTKVLLDLLGPDPAMLKEDSEGFWADVDVDYAEGSYTVGLPVSGDNGNYTVSSVFTVDSADAQDDAEEGILSMLDDSAYNVVE